MSTDVIRRPGRPAGPNRTAKASYETEIYKLLVGKMPQHVHAGRLNVNSLAATINVSRQNFYKRLSDNNLSPALATKLVNASEGRLSLEDLHPFVFS